MIQSHFTTSHVNKYLHLFRQLKDIYFHFSTPGCLFSLLVFFFCSALRPKYDSLCFFRLTFTCLCGTGSWSSGERRFLQIEPKFIGQAWRRVGVGCMWIWPPYLLEEGQSVVVVPAPLRVVQSGLLFKDTIYPRDCNYFFNIFSTGYNLSLFRVMLWFCRIASCPCPRPQTLNISGFHKIQFICQHSLQVFILINQSSIIFTKDCREILKNPFIIIYEETPPWSREYCLQYLISPPPHPTRCWKLGGPKRGADPRVHVGG